VGRSRGGRVPPLADRTDGGTPVGDCRPASRQLKQTPRQTLRLLAIAAALLLLLAALPPLTAWTGLKVLVLTLAGYGALLGFLYLFLFPLRVRRLMPGGSLNLARHRLIADWALILTLLHGFGYLVVEPATLRYLSPAAPVYMLAGLAALLFLAILATTSRHDARQGMARSWFGFRSQHVVLSALLLAATLVHVLGAGLVADALWKRAALALVTALAIAGLLRPAPRSP
jgi:DMSO/TMAO reductase YedYZ heme-binding membrane subunit